MTHAQPQVNARNHSALMNSTIVQSFWWPHSRADVACILKTSPSHIKRVWDEAKDSGQLPRIERPAKGFNMETLFMARVSAGRAA